MSPAVDERRRHARVPVQLDASLTRIGVNAHDEPVKTVDLSEGGAGIVGTDRFNVGDVVVPGAGAVLQARASSRDFR